MSGKICVCCCTYLRPAQLGWVVAMFERQTYENRYLVVLDDCGMYDPQRGDRWELHSVSKRFGSLGEKRNACAALAPKDTDWLASWDDDDLYFDWHLEISAMALEIAEWSVPSTVLHMNPDHTFRQHMTGPGKFYHAGMLWHRDLFERAGGYPPYSGPEDQGIFRRFEALGATVADPVLLSGKPPGYVWCGDFTGSVSHISGLLDGQDNGERAWEKMECRYVGPKIAKLPVKLPPWLDLDNIVIYPEVLPRPF